MNKTVCIFGPRSQDAWALKTYLEKLGGYEITLPEVNINSITKIREIVSNKYDYIVNFAANTDTSSSCRNPFDVITTNCSAVANMLQCILEESPTTRFVNAGSIKENSKEKIYGFSKLWAREIIEFYRRKYNLFAIQVRLSNHFSRNSKEKLIIPKIVAWAARTKRAIENRTEIYPIELGNLNATITILHANDIVEGIWAAANHKVPYDFTFSSLVKYSVRTIVERVMELNGIEFERSIIISNTEYFSKYLKTPLVKRNPDLFEKFEDTVLNDLEILQTAKILKWLPKISGDDVLKEMVKHYA